MAVATFDDVAVSLGRSISTVTEQDQITWWLTGVEMLIRIRLGDPTALDQVALKFVEVEAVAAKVRRHGTTEESISVAIDDGTVTRRYRDPVSASDITDEWWHLLDPDSDTATASIRPYFEPDTAQWAVRTPPLCGTVDRTDWDWPA